MADTELEEAFPPQWSQPDTGTKRSRRMLVTVTVLLLAFAVGGVLWAKGAFWAPVRLNQVISAKYTVAGRAPALPWPAHGEAYRELNFAPSTEWAAYSFERYRTGMAAITLPSAPRIDVTRTGSQLVLDARV